jgi:hypothetical protein
MLAPAGVRSRGGASILRISEKRDDGFSEIRQKKSVHVRSKGSFYGKIFWNPGFLKKKVVMCGRL